MKEQSKVKRGEGGAGAAGVGGAVDAAGAGAVGGASTGGADADVLNQVQAQVASLTADLQRTRADFENYRKQVDGQKAQAVAMAEYATVLKLLPLLDDLARAMATYEELAPLKKSLDKALTELKLTTMETELGTEFDPDVHEAVLVEDGEGEREVIAETLRPGYWYDGEVLRPAMVKVKRV